MPREPAAQQVLRQYSRRPKGAIAVGSSPLTGREGGSDGLPLGGPADPAVAPGDLSGGVPAPGGAEDGQGGRPRPGPAPAAAPDPPPLPTRRSSDLW